MTSTQYDASVAFAVALGKVRVGGCPQCRYGGEVRPESPPPLPGVKRLNADLFRAVSDARERGVTRQQIKLRLQDQMAAFEDVDIESKEPS